MSLLALSTLGCGGSVVSTSGDAAAGDHVAPGRDAGVGDRVAPDGPAARVPMNHRPNDAPCMTTPPASNCNNPNPTNTCHADSNCMKGLNGRCVISGQDSLTCACTYDACMSDAQCKKGGPCACHGTAYVNTGNYCAAGNCQVDSDCEGGSGFCSPSDPTVGCGGSPDYYCHTPADRCVDNSDCGPGSCGGGTSCGCAYDTKSRRWTCQAFLGCA